MGVDGIKRKIRRSGQMDYFRARGFELAAKLIMLRLRGREIGHVEESQLLPAFRLDGDVPSGGPWRTYQYALERPHHGVSVECRASERLFA